MNVFFTIHYNTNWGDQLFVSGNFHSSEKDNRIPLTYVNDGVWKLETSIVAQNTVCYKYILLTSDGIEVTEPVWRIFKPSGKLPVTVTDQWLSPDSNENLLYRSPFEHAIFKHNRLPDHTTYTLHEGLNFSLSVPRIRKGCKLCVSGNIDALGNWDPYTPLVLECGEFAAWFGGIDRIPEKREIQYKYAIYDVKNKSIIDWEEGENRIFAIRPNTTNLIGDANFRFATPWKGSGMAIPVFSIRTNNGLGIGEFNDLKILGDWVSKMGMNLIQILPVNDTLSHFNWTDSYPYNAISVYALNPVYICLDDLFKHDNSILTFLKAQKEALNAFNKIDFEAVLKLKIEYLHKAYSYYQDGLVTDPEFMAFYKRNEFWIKAYAVFCYLRDYYKTTDFTRWEDFATYNDSFLNDFFSPDHTHFYEVMFYVFVQYHLDKQLSAAVEYIHNKGIALKGDIPIGVSRESVDAWAYADLFNFDQQTGAPPDYFSTVGQNWGFPTYNWKKMKTDGYEWWKRRFEKMADYFDAYRIDHILGFFRIWEIPVKYAEGLMGHFSPALPYTIEELKASGIPFEAKWWCTPHLYLNEAKSFFGAHHKTVLEHFFYPEGEFFFLKKVFQQTKNLFDECLHLGLNDDAVVLKLRDVICDVLFLEDETTANHYHPRIELQRTRKFDSLPDWIQHKLMVLYNDFFYKRHDDFWRDQALKKLPALIKTTNMMVCGEDLGMIPANVPQVMNALRILTLDIQTMPKDPGVEFADPGWFSYYSICTTSTHDTPTLRGLWKYDPAKGIRLIKSFSHENVPWSEDCPGWLCRKIIEVNLRAGSAFTILPFQDWISVNESLRLNDPHAERINKPEFSRHYWQYRMHLSVEDLLNNEQFIKNILDLIQCSGRLNAQYSPVF